MNVIKIIHVAIISLLISISKAYCFDRCLYQDGYTVDGIELKTTELKFICSDSLAVKQIFSNNLAIRADDDFCFVKIGKAVNTGIDIQYSLESDRILKICNLRMNCIDAFISSIDSIKCTKTAVSSTGTNHSSKNRREDSISPTPEGIVAFAILSVGVLGLIYLISNVNNHNWKMIDP